jgi:hypothetical protein
MDDATTTSLETKRTAIELFLGQSTGNIVLVVSKLPL